MSETERVTDLSQEVEADKVSAEARLLRAQAFKLEVEAEKVRLEADLLANERAIKEAEYLRLLAERDKFQAETADINKHVLLRPVTWLTLGSAFVALVAGITTYFSHSASEAREMTEKYANAAKELASISEKQRSGLEAENLTLTKQKEQLEKEKAGLEKTKGALENLEAGLRVQNGALTAQNTHLTSQNAAAHQSLTLLEGQVDQSKSQLAQLGVRRTIASFQRLTPDRITLFDIEALVKEMRELEGNPKEFGNAITELRSQATSSEGIYKVAYLYVLATVDTRSTSKDQLKGLLTNEQSSTDGSTLVLPAVREILKTSLFDVNDRANFLGLIDQKHLVDCTWNPPGAAAFVLWDREADVQYPALYASCLNSLIIKKYVALHDSEGLSDDAFLYSPGLELDTRKDSSFDRIFVELSPQVATAALLRALMDDADKNFRRRFNTVTVLLRVEEMKKIHDTFPSDFPCKDVETGGGDRICYISRTENRDIEWIRSNAQLLETLQFLPRYVEGKRKSTPSQFLSDLIMSKWVTREEADAFINAQASK